MADTQFVTERIDGWKDRQMDRGCYFKMPPEVPSGT